MFEVLIITCYLLFVLYCINAIVSATCKATLQVTGATPVEHLQVAYTWVILNPTWAWDLLEIVSPTKEGNKAYLTF